MNPSFWQPLLCAAHLCETKQSKGSVRGHLPEKSQAPCFSYTKLSVYMLNSWIKHGMPEGIGWNPWPSFQKEASPKMFAYLCLVWDSTLAGSWISQVNVVFSPVLGAVSLATGCPKLIAVPWYCEWSGRSGCVFLFWSLAGKLFPGLNCLCGHPRFKFRFNIWWINH